ncbi:TetR/AcrR family transcriptional regulator [Trebonia sp.]|uniref:TetR/AcrR family transcriptional regulator n=1 Tax=Trebonia sp. TaxID=2767075 RepID=UPI002638ED91|nr:TetR/AcrR family transcriptional regulator [Trebonia sp.]
MVDTPIRDRKTERREATKAEILDTAWDLVREQGLGGLNLRDLAARIGMRAPSLYEYFASKHAIYDAMFVQGYRQFAAVMAETEELAGEDGLRAGAHHAMAFMVEDPARYQLLFHRTIPGFTPSPQSYAVSVQQLEGTRAWFSRNGFASPAALDLFTSLIVGLAGQQIANDPGGDHWVRLVDAAVDMFLTHFKAPGPDTTAGPMRERKRS